MVLVMYLLAFQQSSAEMVIEELVPISLSEEERTKLSESAAVLKKTMEGVEF